jgi:hypothetical protein
MGNNIINSILGNKTTQPKVPVTSPPFSGPGSGHAAPNIPSTIERKPAGPFGSNEIDTNDLSCVTANVIFPAGVEGIFDYLVELGFSAKRVMIASIGPTQADEATGIWISLRPTGVGGSTHSVALAYVPIGTEQWIQIRSADAVNTIYPEGTILEFRKPISRLYLSVSAAALAGTTFTITFMKADDICEITWRPQANTAG